MRKLDPRLQTYVNSKVDEILSTADKSVETDRAFVTGFTYAMYCVAFDLQDASIADQFNQIVERLNDDR